MKSWTTFRNAKIKNDNTKAKLILKPLVQKVHSGVCEH